MFQFALSHADFKLVSYAQKKQMKISYLLYNNSVRTKHGLLITLNFNGKKITIIHKLLVEVNCLLHPFK